MLTFFVTMFPCSSVNCSSLTCPPGRSSTSSPCWQENNHAHVLLFKNQKWNTLPKLWAWEIKTCFLNELGCSMVCYGSYQSLRLTLMWSIVVSSDKPPSSVILVSLSFSLHFYLSVCDYFPVIYFCCIDLFVLSLFLFLLLFLRWCHIF